MNFQKVISTVACAVLVALASCSAKNDTKSDTQTPQRNAQDVVMGLRFKQFASNVKLTGEQQPQVKAIFEEENKAITAVQSDEKLSMLEKSQRVTALHKETYEKIRPLLSANQLEAFQKVVDRLDRKKKKTGA